jgi:hypothetical protein
MGACPILSTRRRRTRRAKGVHIPLRRCEHLFDRVSANMQHGRRNYRGLRFQRELPCTDSLRPMFAADGWNSREDPGQLAHRPVYRFAVLANLHARIKYLPEILRNLQCGDQNIAADRIGQVHQSVHERIRSILDQGRRARLLMQFLLESVMKAGNQDSPRRSTGGKNEHAGIQSGSRSLRNK